MGKQKSWINEGEAARGYEDRWASLTLLAFLPILELRDVAEQLKRGFYYRLCCEAVFGLVPAGEEYALDSKFFGDIVIVVGVSNKQELLGWECQGLQELLSLF